MNFVIHLKGSQEESWRGKLLEVRKEYTEECDICFLYIMAVGEAKEKFPYYLHLVVLDLV